MKITRRGWKGKLHLGPLRPDGTRVVEFDARAPDGWWVYDTANAVVLSELAATILQGFPGSWVFSGKTKTVRWSQLGQAMPPPLAEAVASAVRQQLERSVTALETA